MSDYKANQVSGYQRSGSGTFSNPKGGIPSIVFNEEVLVNVANQVFVRPCGSVSAALEDPAKSLILLNPLDDTVIGQATYQDVFIMLYSLYRQTADERDAVAEA